jgi:hypothetical protein
MGDTGSLWEIIEKVGMLEDMGDLSQAPARDLGLGSGIRGGGISGELDHLISSGGKESMIDSLTKTLTESSTLTCGRI